jgi:eukaryotic-like serine/threonine-protein kinase
MQGTETLFANREPAGNLCQPVSEKLHELTRSMVGRMIGSYRVLALLGAGGMGHVYRAKDTKLGRDVAIKILPDQFSSNWQWVKRFEQEARAASALNHPNVVTIHEIGQIGSLYFIVMELIEGQTLRKILGQGSLPIKEVVGLAAQLADGLAKAHEAGITHRDLKPENLMVTRDGLVKILDFGLAKLSEPQEGKVESGVSTQSGVLVGTVGYMSPEQVRGGRVGIQSDQFAFGTMLYEMATGKRAFQGATPVETLSAIIRDDPPAIAQLNPRVPVPLRWILERCLAKNPQDRYVSTRDLARDIQNLRDRFSEVRTQTARPERQALSAWIASGVFLLLAALAVGILYFKTAPATAGRPVVFSVFPPEQETFDFASLSPDGNLLAYASHKLGGASRLWIRPLDSLVPRPLPGTEGAGAFFWSPDNNFIGFFADGKLKKVDVSGKLPQILCEAPEPRGGTWNHEGTIIFARSANEGLFRISSAGGEPSPVTTPDLSRQEISHRWPQFLPDGRHFILFVRGHGNEASAIRTGSLESRETEALLSADTNALYAAPGHLLFIRAGTLLAQPFDAGLRQLQGEPVLLTEQVAYSAGKGHGFFSASQNGVLVYANAVSLNSQLTWFDRNGKQTGSIGEPGIQRCPTLSHDESKVAVERLDPQTRTYDIWLVTLANGALRRFTFDPFNDGNAAWSHDDRRILFTSNRKAHWDIYQKDVYGAGGDEIVIEGGDPKNVDHWSEDERYVVYTSSGPQTQNDLWVLPLLEGRTPVPLLRTRFNEVQGQVSPDGRWLSFASNESGTLEVYVQPFPASGARWQISTNGGAQPAWRSDGKELFYLSGDRKLVAVEVNAGSSFEPGARKVLFQTRVSGLVNARNHYAVTKDGQRFLINALVQDATSQPYNVMLNWIQTLPR